MRMVWGGSDNRHPTVCSALFAVLASMLIFFAAGSWIPIGQIAFAQTIISGVWRPEIAVVWPQDGSGVAVSLEQSHSVNVAIWPTNTVPCSQMPITPVTLWIAKNNNPLTPVSVAPSLNLRTFDGSTFPYLAYNGVSADITDDPNAMYTLMAGVSGAGVGSNVWVHAADARTYYPHPVVPSGIGPSNPFFVDARIQIVWPHDAQGHYAPPDQATLVNVAVDIFAHGTLESVPVDWEPDAIFLEVARGNDPPREAGPPSLPAQKITYSVNGNTFPRWIFNNVPVVPGQQYHFIPGIDVHKVPDPYVSVWTHGSDARTYLPTPPVPPSCAHVTIPNPL